LDIKNNWIIGNTFSTLPDLASRNEIENRDRFNLALFALNAWKINDALELRQNITSDLSTLPFSVGQIGVSYSSAGWGLNLYASYNSGARRALFAQSGISSTEFTAPYLSLDVSARILLWQGLTTLIYLENLADVPYERVNRTFSPGLTYRLALQSKF
jgi:hypothetical protein